MPRGKVTDITGETMHPFRDSEYEWVLTSVALVVEEDSLNPEYVTEILQVQPTSSGKPSISPWWPEPLPGSWAWEVNEHTSRDFTTQLNQALEIIEQKRGELKLLTNEGIDVYLHIYGFAGNNSAVTISGDQMRKLSLAGIPVLFSPNTNER
ncbi:DUF4279 domain-containing protein [Streptomyces sp. 549]|uniref:DUF4279 domain-containing protein n=1 Tax=Streptomyces sp. 549 TaxID=3049076 RepID=UPI0024C38F1D|nr:DUF4279 domain-containing protein [Streptomyces sp. 549]MDK1473072.1 DUF4279 domain-containing protein [Streptomyces sp. 549]